MGERIAAFMIEPIQGSAGYVSNAVWMVYVNLNRIVAPPEGYLKEVAAV